MLVGAKARTRGSIDASPVGLRSLPGLWQRQDWRLGYHHQVSFGAEGRRESRAHES